jgi:hypothetical protein
MKKIRDGKDILTLSRGNTKLVSTEDKQFLIWNLPAQSTCPFATEQCKHSCYAMKAQRMYPSVCKSREEQFNDSCKDTFVTDMVNTINYYINLKSIKNKEVYFRIHESGDFYNQRYYDNWIQIINNFPNIHFLAYTKSIKYVHESKLERPSNFIIRFSIWDDTKQDQVDLTKEMDLPIFTAFPKDELEEKATNEHYSQCAGSCDVCKKCYGNSISKIAIAIH